MARIRSIKPEFWTSEQVIECSTNARLMFIGMWNFADDHGRLPFSPKSIKAQIFPADDIDVETIRRMIDELSSNGLLLQYEIDGKEFLQITGWHHQKIDRRQEPKYPAPPDRSTNDRRTFVPDRIGEERKGKDSAAPAAPNPSSPEIDYFRRVKEICGAAGGGLGKKLLDAKGGSIPLARAAVEQASTKQDPREYLGAIIRGRGGGVEDLRARGEAW